MNYLNYVVAYFSDPNPDTIRWVLTVPAIWTEASKKFMREAAEKVSIFTLICPSHISSRLFSYVSRLLQTYIISYIKPSIDT